MWIKFSILMLVALLNLSLGILISIKNQGKEKFIKYFVLLYFSATIWTLGLGFALLITDANLFLIIARVFYVAATVIVLSFFMFSVHFLYSYKLNKIFKYIISLFTLYIFYIILSGDLFIGVYEYRGLMHELEDSILHLIYGIYFIGIMIYSHYLLFLKYRESQGINKSRLLFVIIGTLTSFVFGTFFAWYMPYINKHYLDWIGPVFVFFMTFSISYLLFKKENE